MNQTFFIFVVDIDSNGEVDVIEFRESKGLELLGEGLVVGSAASLSSSSLTTSSTTSSSFSSTASSVPEKVESVIESGNQS